MGRKILNDKLIIQIIENVENSGEKEKIYQYIQDVSTRCSELCRKGEPLRVLSEYKFMIENLMEKFGL